MFPPYLRYRTAAERAKGASTAAMHAGLGALLAMK